MATILPQFYSRTSFLDRAIDSPALRTGEHDDGFGAARKASKAGHKYPPREFNRNLKAKARVEINSKADANG
jgi:hypothetical protein